MHIRNFKKSLHIFFTMQLSPLQEELLKIDARFTSDREKISLQWIIQYGLGTPPSEFALQFIAHTFVFQKNRQGLPSSCCLVEEFPEYKDSLNIATLRSIRFYGKN